MKCEVCGRQIVGATHRVMIEGVAMNVCVECVPLGREIGPPRPTRADDAAEDFELDLVEEYLELIRHGREQRGLAQVEFAKRLSERVSVVQRLESGRLRPDERLAKKSSKRSTSRSSRASPRNRCPYDYQNDYHCRYEQNIKWLY